MYANQDKYNRKQKMKGLARVTIWVPEGDKKLITAYAKGLIKARADRESLKV